jgi:hypothetical protein
VLPRVLLISFWWRQESQRPALIDVRLARRRTADVAPTP